MSLFAELKRRNVLRVAIAYTAAAWVLIQVVDIVFPRLGLSETAVTNIILLLAIGFIPSVVIAWFFELTPEGLKRDSDVSPGESIAPRTSKTLDRLIVVMLVLAVGFLAVDKFVLDPARDLFRVTRGGPYSPSVLRKSSRRLPNWSDLKLGNEYTHDSRRELSSSACAARDSSDVALKPTLVPSAVT